MSGILSMPASATTLWPPPSLSPVQKYRSTGVPAGNRPPWFSFLLDLSPLSRKSPESSNTLALGNAPQHRVGRHEREVRIPSRPSVPPESYATSIECSYEAPLCRPDTPPRSEALRLNRCSPSRSGISLPFQRIENFGPVIKAGPARRTNTNWTSGSTASRTAS